MLIGETIGVALSAVRANKLRSLLTMLGIVIGVAAVITMVALGNGAQQAIQAQIDALGTNLLSVHPGQSFQRGVASEQRVALTVDDATALGRDGGPLLAEVVPELAGNRQIKYGNRNINVSVNSTTSNYFPVNKYELLAGRYFTRGDDQNRRRVAVLAGAVPRQLDANPVGLIGQTIQIGGIPFEVVGVLIEKGATNSFNNPDEQIFIPIQTGRFRVFGHDRVRSITVQVASTDSMNAGLLTIERVMRREHGIRPGGDNDFQIRNRGDFLATREESTRTFTFLLAGIAAVSLLVGGIGIMNIMLVSVTERTREIGVRKALGATKANILTQFLVEAMVLCLLGGVVGVGVGIGGAVALSELANWNTQVPPMAIGIAVAFSGVVGIFFGMWPAQRAARLDPIQALRYE